MKLNKDLEPEELEHKLDVIEKIKNINRSLKDLEETSNKEKYLLESSHLLFNYYENNQNTETSGQSRFLSSISQNVNPNFK